MVDDIGSVSAPGSSRGTLQIVKEKRERQELVKWIRENLTQSGTNLGVSHEYLARMADDLTLTHDELETIATIRIQHQAKIPAIRALLTKEGLTLQEVQGIYEARDSAIAQLNDDQANVSLKQIARFVRIFPSATPDEDLGEQIADIHNKVKEILPWVKYPSGSLGLLCDVAEYYGLADVHTAINALSKKHPVD